MTIEQEGHIKVGITCGDLNGIGLEVIMKTFLDNRMHQICTPVIYAGQKTVSMQRKLLELNDFNYQTIRNSNEIILRKNNVASCWEDEVPIEWGQATEISGKYALRSLEAATKDLADKKIDVLVTAPINKHNIQGPDFQFKGHTEYLAAKFDSPKYLMMLVSDTLRVAVATGHIPVQEVSQHMNIETIITRVKQMIHTLKRDFGIRKPRIAILGLNPHAGDNGLIGKEEQEVIIPAVKLLFDENQFVYGPYSADGFFGSGAYKNFDAVLAMYHDQGLIPFKSISFSSGVNYTAGLPVIRTSPDHGTAYDIAGKGTASEESIREAIYVAIDILKMRTEYDEISANPMAVAKPNNRDRDY
ncbi:4-hydroxythreonine-4-phosphate dehydrogenase PdxA [soil metagenome]